MGLQVKIVFRKFLAFEDDVSGGRYFVMRNLGIYIGHLLMFGCKIKEILLVRLWN
jgi:hypothetical protein